MSFKGPIGDILPHDMPMILLDRYVSSTETGLTAEVIITEDAPFFSEGNGVPAYIGVEYIAQAIAAFNGLKDLKNGTEVQPGFLLGSRKVELKCDHFPLDSRPVVKVETSFNDGEMAVFDGTVTLNDKIVVNGRINVYQPADPSLMLSQDHQADQTTKTVD
ncbi:3-hydroxylacyl-ACP dehydratase [Sneathiella sp. P13V-1]|uniref:ApeP family dehydratase n=1 Tax=Sneathiella sp. P13V-1 TaxID=2697366 RepID=UPI00187B4AA1|nr:3-hydroxylacyl-ACP dehydratase [Sneathiella sp. P13V-1]MBE7636510.1 3-hydroxylacyl-ACP dehydratase [Sneathiella sp. P13V-1]